MHPNAKVDEERLTELKHQLRQNLDKLLTRKGMSQSTLAKKCGIDKSRISNLMTGKFTRVPEKLISNIATHLGIKREVLTGELPLEHLDEKELSRKRAEFGLAESARVYKSVYDFLEMDVARNGTPFSSKGSAMERRPVGKTMLPVPVTVLSRDTPISLRPLVTHGIQVIPDIEANEYIRTRDSITHNLVGHVDKITYSLADLSLEQDFCEITGGLTRYMSAIATHDVLEHELLVAARELGPSAPVAALKGKLEKRAAFREQSKALQRQYAALAISVVIIYATRSGHKVMFRKRSSTTAVHANLFHVIPACMFQAEKNTFTEWDLQYCIIKEYSEELFGEEVNDRRDDPLYIYEEWPSATSLVEALSNKSAELIHCGVVINLLNLRPEICCALILREPWWVKENWRKMEPNWEYVKRAEMIDRTGAAISDFNLDSVEKEFSTVCGGSGVAGADMTGLWDPPGLAALWLAVDAARARL